MIDLLYFKTFDKLKMILDLSSKGPNRKGSSSKVFFLLKFSIFIYERGTKPCSSYFLVDRQKIGGTDGRADDVESLRFVWKGRIHGHKSQLAEMS